MIVPFFPPFNFPHSFSLYHSCATSINFINFQERSISLSLLIGFYFSFISSLYFFLFRLGIKSECCEEDVNNSRNAHARTDCVTDGVAIGACMSFSFVQRHNLVRKTFHSFHVVRSMQSTFIPFSLFQSFSHLSLIHLSLLPAGFSS